MNNTREKVATNAGKINDTNFSLKNGKVHIFPFIIRNGYQNVTEVGFVSKDKNPDNYSFFQKVFTGRETITATWEDSTKLNVRDASLGTYNYDFDVGKYYEGMIVPGTLTQSLEIGDVNGNDSFLAMQESSEVTVIFSRNELETNSTDFIPTEDDLYKLYIIPETKLKNKWLYISNVTTYTNPKNSSNILTEVTFVSLKDKLETSGRALEQYVQYAAPGEPYAFPFITLENKVIVSPSRLTTNPVKYLQVELQGGNAFSSVIVFGRRLYWDDANKKWFTSPSKFLFPYRFANPQANPLNKTSSPSKNFYCFPNETLETRSTKEWLEAIKAEGTELAPIKNMGTFTMSGTWTDGIHQSNQLDANGSHIDYFNSNWKPLNGMSDLPIIDTTGNVYCGNSVVYTANDNLKQILIKNSMCNMIQLELPLDFKQTRPYRWSTLPIIGFWTRWFGDRVMSSNTTQVRTNHICYLIDTNIATLARNAYVQKGNTPEGYGNLQIFNGEDAPSMLNPQSANTTICFELSDKVSFTDAKYNDNPEHSRPLANGIDTVYLSQKKDEYGVNLHNDGTALTLNCEDSNIDVKYVDYGFVIDSVIVNALHIGKVKISCYGKSQGNELSNPSFTQTVMSNSMFEEHNIRNWTTDITLGCWDSNWSEGKIIWPLEPQKEISPIIDIDAYGRIFAFWDTIIEHSYHLSYRNNPHYDLIGLTQCNNNLTEANCGITFAENTLIWSELPGSYSSKEDFKSKVDKIKLTFNGTIFEGKIIKSLNADNIPRYIDLSWFTNDEITITFAICSLNDMNYNPCAFEEDKNIVISVGNDNKQIGLFDGWISQRVTVNIILRDDGLYYKFIDNTSIGTIGFSGVETLKNGYGMDVTNEKIFEVRYHTQIHIDKMSFIGK